MAWLKAICNHGPGRQSVSTDWQYAASATKLAKEEFAREVRERYAEWDQPAVVRIKVFRGLPKTVRANMIASAKSRIRSGRASLKLLAKTPELPDPRPIRCRTCKGTGIRKITSGEGNLLKLPCVMCNSTGKVRRMEDC